MKLKSQFFCISILFFSVALGSCPGGTECPAGCCPIPDAYCCADNVHCAIQESDCPHKENDFIKTIQPSFLRKGMSCSPGTECSSGCCPLENATCCPDSPYCATSLRDCPKIDRSFRSAPLRRSTDSVCPGGTECPSGCCPMENAFCCEDNIYCAPRLEDCPSLSGRLSPKSRDNCPDGTLCPNGCCPIENAFCCPDGLYCATSESKCPKTHRLLTLHPVMLAASQPKADNCPGGTECPSGCCPLENAFCCKDEIYCAKEESLCPKSESWRSMALLNGIRADNCPGGTECPSGCCDIPNAYCCLDNVFCAISPEKCPNFRQIIKNFR